MLNSIRELQTNVDKHSLAVLITKQKEIAFNGSAALHLWKWAF